MGQTSIHISRILWQLAPRGLSTPLCTYPNDCSSETCRRWRERDGVWFLTFQSQRSVGVALSCQQPPVYSSLPTGQLLRRLGCKRLPTGLPFPAVIMRRWPLKRVEVRVPADASDQQGPKDKPEFLSNRYTDGEEARQHERIKFCNRPAANKILRLSPQMTKRTHLVGRPQPIKRRAHRLQQTKCELPAAPNLAYKKATPEFRFFREAQRARGT